MKPAVWAFPSTLKHYPNNSWLVYDYRHPFILAFVYVGLWAVVTKVLYKPKKNFWPIVHSFLLGGVFIIFHYYWSTSNWGYALDRDTHSLVTYPATLPYKIVYKSPYDDIFKKNKQMGVLVDPEKYAEYKKKGLIHDVGLNQLMKKKRHLGEADVNSATPFEQLVDVSYYHMILMFSLTILVAKIDIALFKLIFPWIILSVLFTLVQTAAWFWVPNVEDTARLFIIKQRLFLVGISFSLTAILIILKFNNK